MNRIIKWLLLIFVATLVVGGIASAMLTRSTGVTVAELHHEIRKSGDPLYFAEYATEPLNDQRNAFGRGNMLGRFLIAVVVLVA